MAWFDGCYGSRCGNYMRCAWFHDGHGNEAYRCLFSTPYALGDVELVGILLGLAVTLVLLLILIRASRSSDDEDWVAEDALKKTKKTRKVTQRLRAEEELANTLIRAERARAELNFWQKKARR